MTTRNGAQEEGFDMANQWKASGMTAEQFAHAEGVTHHTVRYWAGRLRQHIANQPEQNHAQLIELTPAPSSPSRHAAELAIVFPNGIRVEIGSCTDAAGLLRLVASL